MIEMTPAEILLEAICDRDDEGRGPMPLLVVAGEMRIAPDEARSLLDEMAAAGHVITADGGRTWSITDQGRETL